MSENANPAPQIAIAPEPVDSMVNDPMMTPVESRLSADQIAALDQMNSSFGGKQLAEPKKDDSPAGDSGKNGTVQPAPEQPASTESSEFLPPTDLVAAAEQSAADTKTDVAPKTDEFKPGSEIMPDDEINKLRTEKAKTNIHDLRANYDKALSLLKSHREKVAELEKKGAGDVDARVADLEKRNAEQNARLEELDLERHPYVLKTFVEPRKNAVDYGKKALQTADMDPALLDQALGKSDKERIAALDQLYESIESPTLRAKVEKAVTVIEATDDQRDAFFADREANIAKMKEEQKVLNQRELAEQEKNLTSAIDNIVGHLAKEKGFSFLAASDKPGAEKWNEGLKSDIAEVTDFLKTNQDPMKVISLSLLGIRAPRMQVAYNAVLKRAIAAEKALAESKAGVPRVNGEMQVSRTANQIDPNENLAQAGMRVLREVRAE